MEATEAIKPSNLMTVQEYAKFIGVERQTVYNWIREGTVKKVTFLGKTFVDKTTKK